MARHILLGNMACLADSGNSNERYQKFLKVGRPPFKSLIEGVLLFDQIVIPTNDFMPLALMAGVLGERPVIRLLDEEIIKFARFRGALGYLGNGGGINIFQLSSSKKIPKLFSSPLYEAAQRAIEGVDAKLDKVKIRDLAIRATVEFGLETNLIKDMAYGELVKNPQFIRAQGNVDLNRLPGIGPNQVRVLSGVLGENQTDDIFQTLRAAQACIEVQAAAITSCDDIYTSDQVAELFRSAMIRATEQSHPGNAYVVLKKLANLPDIGELALQNKSSIDSILDIRNSNSGVQFRKWFHENCRIDSLATAKEYAAIVGQVPTIQSVGVRTLRFFAQVAVATAAMALTPMAGLAAGIAANAIDTYLVDRIFRGSSPKVFLDRLQAVTSSSHS